MTGAPSRRSVLAALGLGAASAATSRGTALAAGTAARPSRGRRQGGITTPPQPHLRFLAFDVTAADRAQLARLLHGWTEVAARLALEHRSDHLTLTFGVGPTLFARSGRVRFGLSGRRPRRLVDLPRFTGDAFEPSRSGGDVMLQVCGDDPSVVRSSAQALVRQAHGRAALRWAQNGTRGRHRLPRNQFGFHDGNGNLEVTDASAMNEHVWVGSGSSWLAGGTYLVVRRIRMDLQQWGAETVAQQEQTIGRFKDSGAPLSGGGPEAPVDLTSVDASGRLLEPSGCHVVVAHPDNNNGVQLLRRSYLYDDGVAAFGRRDTGLLFCAFTNDPVGKFVPMQHRLGRHDALQRYVVGTASAVFAVPRALRSGETWADQVLGR